MTDKSRREFEAHIKKIYRYPLLERREQGFPLNGEYITSSREDEWRIWQAAWQASRAAIEIDILEMKRNMESWNHDHISTPGYVMDALWRKHFGLNEAGKGDGETDVLSAK